MLIADICMIRCNSKQMTQVEGEHMPLIMHCWHMAEWYILLWCTLVDKDCCCWWYQEVLSNELELYIHSADTWTTTQSRFLGDMMMSSYLYDDRLILTYVDWCRCSQVIILGSCRTWCWWNGHGGFTYDIMWMISWWCFKRMSWHLCSDIPVTQLFQVADMEMVVREFHKDYPHICACSCEYSRVYDNLKEISGSISEWEDSDMDLPETIWHRFRGEQINFQWCIVGIILRSFCF